MAGLCLLNVRELKLLEIFFFPGLKFCRCIAANPGNLQ
jgi:hypothetical protein